MDFMSGLANIKEEMNNFSLTENNAVGYKTTNSALIDLNFKTASYRQRGEAEIVADFMKAYGENKVLALKWLFFARDIRGGMGERRLFRAVIKRLDTRIMDKLIELIPFYGRYDDLLELIGNDSAINFISRQLQKDCENMRANQPVSLLAKWLPSENTSSRDTRKQARMLMDKLMLAPSAYRKKLSSLRAYLKVTETFMAAGQWREIDYQSVPSKANMLYNNAFIRHDEERRRQYLQDVGTGKAKVNAAALYPHEVVARYDQTPNLDINLENIWNNLPNTLPDSDAGFLVVRDGSGSMTNPISGNTTALHVSTALAIYFAERLGGTFHNRFITFSAQPQFIDLSGLPTLHAKLCRIYREDDFTNTDMALTMDLVLAVARQNRLKQQEIPAILIISDMEFDEAHEQSYRMTKADNRHYQEKLFWSIAVKWYAAGYELPRMIFWNVNSRTDSIPMIDSKTGLVLISGFSPNITDMVMSNITDPYEVLVKLLNSPRYEPVEKAIA